MEGTNMFPLLFGFILAGLFGLAAYITYGLEGFILYGWIDLVLSSLIMAGFVVSLMGEFNDCLPCRLKTKFRNIQWLEALCLRTPCIGHRINLFIHN
jgi:hypothetical protein